MQKRVLHLEELKKACFKQCLYFSVEFDNFVQVYVDGSCFDNGKENAKAGAGVYFGYRHPMCVYEQMLLRMFIIKIMNCIGTGISAKPLVTTSKRTM